MKLTLPIIAVLLSNQVILTTCIFVKKGQISVKDEASNSVTNLVTAFKQQKKSLGEGSFGLVKLLKYEKGSKSTLAAVKRIEINVRKKKHTREERGKIQELENELKVLIAMKDSKFAPKYMDCQYSAAAVYVAQEFLYSDLDFKTVRETIRTFSPSQLFNFFLGLFYGLEDLLDQDYIHGDIKPGNLMTDKYYSKIYLIDFGMAQLYDNTNNGGGTPYYMSHDKIFNRKLKPETDLYAAALSIAVILSKENDVFSMTNLKTGQKELLPKECFLGAIRQCLPVILMNVKVVLERYFGEKYQRRLRPQKLIFPTPKDINFTYKDEILEKDMNFVTLLMDVIDYQNSRMSYTRFGRTLEFLDLNYNPEEPQEKKQPLIGLGTKSEIPESDPVQKIISPYDQIVKQRNPGEVRLKPNFEKRIDEPAEMKSPIKKKVQELELPLIKKKIQKLAEPSVENFPPPKRRDLQIYKIQPIDEKHQETDIDEEIEKNTERFNEQTNYLQANEFYQNEANKSQILKKDEKIVDLDDFVDEPQKPFFPEEILMKRGMGEKLPPIEKEVRLEPQMEKITVEKKRKVKAEQIDITERTKAKKMCL